MMVSVARWLETFACSKYADRFEQLGYSTLPSICQLTANHLQQLGVSSTDIYIIMENVLLLQQSVNSLNSPRYLDLTSEPPPSSSTMATPSVSSDVLVRTSFDNCSPQHSPLRMMYHTENLYLPNQRTVVPPSWNDHRSYLHPLESLERLVSLPESQIVNPKSIIDETPDLFSPVLSTTPIVSNLLSNSVKRSSTNDELNASTKKSRLNTTKINERTTDNHPVVTSLLTRGVDPSLPYNPLPSIRSLTTK